MPPKPSSAAPAWPWPFNEVDYRLPDGTYKRLHRGDPIPTSPAVDEPASTPEETQP